MPKASEPTRDDILAAQMAQAKATQAFNAPLWAVIGEKLNDPVVSAALTAVVEAGEQLIGPTLANEQARGASAFGRQIEQFRKIASASANVTARAG